LALIAAANIEAAIYVPAKVCGAVKPRASTNEDTTQKPFRRVVAVGSAIVRGIVIVSVRAFGFGADIDADLSFNLGSGRREANSSDSGSENKTFESIHESSSRQGQEANPLGGGVNVGPPDYTAIP
jgi:hypothetical protein